MVSQLIEAIEVNLEGEKSIPLNRRLAAISSKCLLLSLSDKTDNAQSLFSPKIY